jgi:uncharacterized protein YbaP (TraB family)
MITDASTLTSLLSKEDAETQKKGLTARGVPLAAVNKMRRENPRQAQCIRRHRRAASFR